MRTKPRTIHFDGEPWKYIVAPGYYITLWSPKDKKGSIGQRIDIHTVRELNRYEGRHEYCFNPGAVKAAVECYILGSRKPIKCGAIMECPHCKKMKHGVIDRVDPFMREIHSKTVIIKMCKDCYDDSADAI